MPQIREKAVTTHREKYFDKNLFPAVTKNEYDEILEPDDDLRRAISADEFLERALCIVDKLNKIYLNK